MQINKVNNLDLSIYSQKLDNGLSVYIVPVENKNNIYVTLSTKFGSRIVEFDLNNKKIKVPYGVAHFLEHKMFEQKDGIDPFTFYSERGANANANTSYDKTTYLFSGTNFLEDNINYLLDYVQEPYFTDENVEKEKGIIISECEMYKDKSYSRCYEKILENSFNEDPIRIPVIGTVDSIKLITKEDLYNCYKAFYHPSNMFMVITGNVDPDEVIKIIKNNQGKKEFTNYDVKIKKYNESKKVFKKEDSIDMDVTIPKTMISYKIKLDQFKKLEVRKIRDYISILFDIKFGDTSVANERFIENKIVNGSIGMETVSTDDYILVIISGESDSPKEFIKNIEDEIKTLVVDETEFKRKKKAYIGSIMVLSSDIYLLNNKIMSNIIKYNEVKYDDYDYINNLSMDEMNYIINNIDLTNKTICTVNPK